MDWDSIVITPPRGRGREEGGGDYTDSSQPRTVASSPPVPPADPLGSLPRWDDDENNEALDDVFIRLEVQETMQGLSSAGLLCPREALRIIEAVVSRVCMSVRPSARTSQRVHEAIRDEITGARGLARPSVPRARVRGRDDIESPMHQQLTMWHVAQEVEDAVHQYVCNGTLGSQVASQFHQRVMCRLEKAHPSTRTYDRVHATLRRELVRYTASTQ